MAALRNMAVVILQQTATKMRDGAGAVLVPSISSTAWDAGIANRVVLFQDFGLEYGKESTRHAGVLKAAGIAGPSNGGMEKAVSFAIRDSRVIPIILPKSTAPIDEGIKPSISNSHKQKVEIGDSEGEEGIDDSDDDYGWDAEDEANVNPDLLPPPTQGSDDVLIPGPANMKGEDEEENDEEGGEHELDRSLRLAEEEAYEQDELDQS